MNQLDSIFIMKNKKKQIAYAAVLIPGEPDSDGDIVSAEKIEEVAHLWMEKYRNMDYEHTLDVVAVPVESYILPVAMHVNVGGEVINLPKGTWIIASKIYDPDVWAQVESGKIKGYSIMGTAMADKKGTGLKNKNENMLTGLKNKYINIGGINMKRNIFGQRIKSRYIFSDELIWKDDEFTVTYEHWYSPTNYYDENEVATVYRGDKKLVYDPSKDGKVVYDRETDKEGKTRMELTFPVQHGDIIHVEYKKQASFSRYGNEEVYRDEDVYRVVLE